MTVYREYIISPNKTSPSLYVVATEGRGGKVPNVLAGSFTTERWAKEAIDRYVDTQVEKTSVRKTNTEK